MTFWYDIDKDEGWNAATPEELDAALDALAAFRGPDWPAVAQIAPTADPLAGPVLVAGFYQVYGILRMATRSDGRTLFSRDPISSDTSTIQYIYCENELELPANSQLPAPLIREAVHEFAETGERPTCLLWQEWQYF
ncbi:Imm1 family immunity protein [Actinokineospora pegani]|uniref:Imm1 family immunity protein n=1 Tax=Actinokineospora pegani TaxID=2654637 RepID=UPI0018D278F5|nr:Imm1 family immunity protein [Actinokineospora pegani]